MNTRSSKLVRFVSLVCLAVWALAPPASAQPRPSLGLQFSAEQPTLSLTGQTGTVYSIQYATGLSPTNLWVDRTLLQAQGASNVWTDPLAPTPGQRFYRAVSVATPADPNLVFIQPGTFRMGSPTNEVDRRDGEGPQTVVTISRGFWMGKYEVTQGEYLTVMGSNPSWFNGYRAEDRLDYGTDLSRPVETVRWDEATNYCTQLTQRERAAGLISTNSVYRLPTEAEREYACRARTSTRFSYGDDPGYTELGNYGWYRSNSSYETGTHPVGQKLPNPWGLYDLHGNVFEWCQDWYGPYPGGIALDPQGPATGSYKVFRGGGPYHINCPWPSGPWPSGCGWNLAAPEVCRSAARGDYGSDPGAAYNYNGFRVVLAPGQP